MNKMKQMGLGLLSAVLVACGGGDDGHDHDHEAMHAPVLKAVGDHNVVVNRTLEIQLQATDTDGHQMTWIAEGVTDEPNPFVQTPPAVFDTGTGTLTWTTTGIPLDNYLVRFKVADMQDSAAHDEEIVQISVISTLKNGDLIANRLCIQCHGAALDGGADAIAKINLKGKTVDDINLGLSRVVIMNNAVNLTEEEKSDVAEYLATL